MISTNKPGHEAHCLAVHCSHEKLHPAGTISWYGSFPPASSQLCPQRYSGLTNLFHVPKHFLSTPSWNIPIIVILFSSSDAQCTIDTTRAPKKFPTTSFHLPTICSRARLGDDIPVCLGIEILRPLMIRLCCKNTKDCLPSTGHDGVLEQRIVLSSFNE